MNDIDYSSPWIIVPLIIVVQAFVCAALARHIAHTKNQDEQFYYVVGFIFGIIGLCVAILAPRLEEPEKESASSLESEPQPRPEDWAAYFTQGRIPDNLAWGYFLIYSDRVEFRTFYKTKPQFHFSRISGVRVFLKDEAPTFPGITDLMRSNRIGLEIKTGQEGTSASHYFSFSTRSAPDLLIMRLAEWKAMPENESAVVEVGTPDEKECPYCAETIKAKAIKCRYCGSELDHKNVSR